MQARHLADLQLARARACVCVCVCACARARACVCVLSIAGDVIIFCGFGSAHGVGVWGSDHERRLAIVNFQSRNLAVARGRESAHLQHKGAAL